MNNILEVKKKISDLVGAHNSLDEAVVGTVREEEEQALGHRRQER
jgi:hypothetical protein